MSFNFFFFNQLYLEQNHIDEYDLQFSDVHTEHKEIIMQL